MAGWYVMPGETPFLYHGEEWTYVARRTGPGRYVFGYLRHRGDVVYADYREGKRELAE